MVSKIDICNIALQNLGANIISDLNEDTVEARACNLRYDIVRRAVLASTLWNFASKRVTLSKSTSSPVFGFENVFHLPSDFIRMWGTDKEIDQLTQFSPDFNGYIQSSYSSTYPQADNYQIEIDQDTGDKVLLSDDDTKEIKYIFDQQDTGKFSSQFVEMLAQGITAKICFTVTNNRAQAQEEEAQFTRMIEEAKKIDSQQGTYRRTETSIFLSSRF